MAKRSKRRSSYASRKPKNNHKVVNKENDQEIRKRVQESLDMLLHNGGGSDDFDFDFSTDNHEFGVHVSIDNDIPLFKVKDIEKVLTLTYGGQEEYVNKDQVYAMIRLSKSMVAPDFKVWFDELVEYLFGSVEEIQTPEPQQPQVIIFEIGDKVYRVPRDIPSYQIRDNITLQALKWAWEQQNDNSNIYELRNKAEQQSLMIEDMNRQIREFANQQSKLLQELQQN